MEYETKSFIVTKIRKPSENEPYYNRSCRVYLFDVNDPHLSTIEPKEILEFDGVHKVVIKGFEVGFLLAGNDMLVNNAKRISVKRGNGHLAIESI